ncbi:hypothetical protein TNCV_3803151 [Trichonephila clavipes]|nr:hypothetical protein TNCV_3803151 [Trichonephila clavipes]
MKKRTLAPRPHGSYNASCKNRSVCGHPTGCLPDHQGSAIIMKTAKGGNVLRKHAGSRGRNTTPLEDRYVALVAKRNSNFTPGWKAGKLQILQFLQWPSYSPNLNPIEHSWDALGKDHPSLFSSRAQNRLERGMGQYPPSAPR